jgi:hypothetical protein
LQQRILRCKGTAPQCFRSPLYSQFDDNSSLLKHNLLARWSEGRKGRSNRRKPASLAEFYSMILLAPISLNPFSQTGSFLAVPAMIGGTWQCTVKAKRGLHRLNLGAQEGNVNASREVENPSVLKSFAEVKMTRNWPTFALMLQSQKFIRLLFKYPVKEFLGIFLNFWMQKHVRLTLMQPVKKWLPSSMMFYRQTTLRNGLMLRLLKCVLLRLQRLR